MNAKQRAAHSERMKAAWARRRLAKAWDKADEHKAQQEQGAFHEAQQTLNQQQDNIFTAKPPQRAFFVNPHTCKTTPIDLSEDVTRVLLLTLYKDGGVTVAEVV